MPRRQQHKKKNKRHRKGSYSEDSRRESSDMPMSTSLEEDLKQQRIRQQEREKMREAEEEKKRTAYEEQNDCCSNDIGFLPPLRSANCHAIVDAGAKSNHLLLKGTVLPASIAPLSKSVENGDHCSSPLLPSVIRLPPSCLFRHIEQTSPTLAVHKRNVLRKLWSTQHHLESMTILPRAASLYCKTKWPIYHSFEYNSDLRCSWDLSCKQRLHSSARTLDLALLGSEPTPTIATIFQDGWGLLRLKSQHKINTIKAPPAYAIRVHERSALCGIIVRQTNTTHHHATPSSYSFRWYPLPHASSYVEAHIPRPVTDFCFGKDIAIFSSLRYSFSSSESLNPLFLPLVEAGDPNNNFTYYNSAVRTINVRNFPQSDALRVEMMCERQEKVVAFGHRNGQVSVLDLRASGTVCSVLQCEESAVVKGTQTSGSRLRPLGSVSDLGFLSSDRLCRSSSSGHQVLVKRSFGSCQLHDLRKASSTYSNSNHNSMTVVQNMSVPPNEIQQMPTSNCNGFAIDPNSHQTMVSPYISSPSGDARLGIWSLETGHMIGSRLLLANHDRNREGTTLYVEVCSKTTSALQPNPSTDGDDDSSFGIWMKCGAVTSGKLRSRVGSLHQVLVPGRSKYEEEYKQSNTS